MKSRTVVQSTAPREAPNAQPRGELAPAAMPVKPAPRLDASMIGSMRGLPGKTDSSLFDQLYRGFAERAHAAHAGINAAAAQGSWADVLTIVHKHRANSAFLGLALYTRRCGELETLAREACEGTPPAAHVWRTALDAAAIELQPSLHALDAHVGAADVESARIVQDAAQRPQRG